MVCMAASTMTIVSGIMRHTCTVQIASVALVASYGFDASVQQIFSTLLLGHTLVIAGEDTRRDGAAMNRWLVDQAIDIFDGTLQIEP